MNNEESLVVKKPEDGSFAQMLAVREEQKAHSVSVDVSRAIREVEAALTVAKARPRDEIDAFKNIMQCCRRVSFAEKAMYAYKRGVDNVEGPSIRLAETLARAYGNIEYGWREVERSPMKSSIEAFCWDLETNTKRKMSFDVLHIRDTKQGRKELQSERDIYEHLANHAARRVRACILSIIPADLIEDAIIACKKSMESGVNSGNKVEYAKNMVLSFEEIGVTHEQLRKFLGVEKVVGATEKQLIELRRIYTSIKDGHSSAREYFNDEQTKGFIGIHTSKSESLAEQLANQINVNSPAK